MKKIYWIAGNINDNAELREISITNFKKRIKCETIMKNSEFFIFLITYCQSLNYDLVKWYLYFDLLFN